MLGSVLLGGFCILSSLVLALALLNGGGDLPVILSMPGSLRKDDINPFGECDSECCGVT